MRPRIAVLRSVAGRSNHQSPSHESIERLSRRKKSFFFVRSSAFTDRPFIRSSRASRARRSRVINRFGCCSAAASATPSGRRAAQRAHAVDAGRRKRGTVDADRLIDSTTEALLHALRPAGTARAQEAAAGADIIDSEYVRRIAQTRLDRTVRMKREGTEIRLPGHDRIAATTRAVIEECAVSPPVIVVGHGAQCIFADRADALHVRVIAPVPDRLRAHRRPHGCGCRICRHAPASRRPGSVGIRSAILPSGVAERSALRSADQYRARVDSEAVTLVAELVDRRGAVSLPTVTTTV